MSGYTGFSVGRVNMRYVYIPIDEMTHPDIKVCVRARARACAPVHDCMHACEYTCLRECMQRCTCLHRACSSACAHKLTRSGCIGHAQVRVDPKSRIYNRMCVHTGQVDMAPSEPPSLEALNVG